MVPCDGGAADDGNGGLDDATQVSGIALIESQQVIDANGFFDIIKHAVDAAKHWGPLESFSI